MKVCDLSLLYQLHGGPHWPGSLLKELVDSLGLGHMVGEATQRLYTHQKVQQEILKLNTSEV